LDKYVGGKTGTKRENDGYHEKKYFLWLYRLFHNGCLLTHILVSFSPTKYNDLHAKGGCVAKTPGETRWA